MHYNLPLTIKNHLGEKLVFHRMEMEEGEEKLVVDNFVAPNAGPLMHIHHRQDESLTVVRGKMGYQVLGEPAKFVGVGETVLFKRGIPHRFWNAGETELNCHGWIRPANNIIFYLSA